MKTTKLLLTALSIFLFSVYGQAQDPNEFTLDKDYTLGANGHIFVDTQDAEIEVIGSSRTDVRVKVYRKVTFTGLNLKAKKINLEVEVTQENGNLYVKDHPFSWTGIGSSREVYEILIEAPNTAGLEAKGDDDDYLIKSMNGAISMEISDGDIALESCNGKSFDFRLDDGDITMDQGQGNIIARLEDGDIKILDGDFKKIDIKVEDGNIRLATKLQDTGEYLLSSDDGSIELQVESGGGQFNIRHDDGSVRTSNGFELVSDSEGRSEYRLSGGKAFITIETEDGGVALMEE
ncbi:MAG: DUF4097 family beta strand repeat-containing protein [Cyclobacteriaceae bacterium]